MRKGMEVVSREREQSVLSSVLCLILFPLTFLLQNLPAVKNPFQVLHLALSPLMPSVRCGGSLQP